MHIDGTKIIGLVFILGMAGCYEPLGGAADPTFEAFSTLPDSGAPDVAIDAPLWSPSGPNFAGVRDVRLEGDFGGVHVDGGECWVRHSNDICIGTSLTVDLRCRSTQGVLMNRLEVEDWRTLPANEGERSGESTRSLSVQACSGAEEDEWITDQTTQDAVVYVEQEPATRNWRVSFVAGFWSGQGAEEHVEGSFVIPYAD